ncbi:galactose oxidase early set domain-containing protein [Asanoa sp. WMMD1127]|uniref:galactose oxidase early set domain-containing protein n=1 Tax=Asanoa sp. WMMD1127 TaxID=3016107 RepID=UPI0024173262|nr:galactose oxidase early set domain-containing protein [Asanoa sp. WMMD1127]MDG4824877.1 galactose oxidase early set domain-containing protein [Asanoa sp. WMMD1127]
MFSPELRRGLGRLLALVLVVTAGLVVAGPARAATNLVQNPGVEQVDGNGFPVCWEKSGQGTNTSTIATTNDAHSGGKAMRITISAFTNGDRKAMMTENAQCAPRVSPGRQYDLSVWYKSTTAANAVTLFRHDTKLGWQYWLDPATLPATNAWTRKTVRTPPVPANTDQITWGVSIYNLGTLTTDDYELVDATAGQGVDACTDAIGCVKGKWQVMPYQSAVRGIHAVVLHNGKVLLVAGSGNDPKAFAAGTFKTAVYDPANGTFTNVATPVDLFCAGHVQLKDGRVLVMGGNKDYPTADGTVGYKGLKNSYIFDPATNKYTRTNDMLAGHWYPSATALGNGDVLSLGGLGEDSTGTTTTDYYSAAQNKWLPMDQTKQTWAWWGLYPAMVLMQDGRLFYTGSHTFGVGLPGGGASIYNYGSGAITDVPGLRRKDERDQSMSVLLPPAQAQRVWTVGGGNGDAGATAHGLTDLVDLKAANPRYTAGPVLPQGTLTGGVPQTGEQGKMYVSLVLLPDGTVFETGGALHNRADPVFEASVFNPNTNTIRAGMATDPVPRTYHSSAFLLPDGRVMAVGDNPGNGSFDTRISVYSPTYLFKGARPAITNVASTNWKYGTTQRITVNGAVTRASLIRPAAVTHSSDPNQRFVELPMTVRNGTTIDLNVTNNPNMAPAGWYMLFVHNAKGVPSVAKWVKLG